MRWHPHAPVRPVSTALPSRRSPAEAGTLAPACSFPSRPWTSPMNMVRSERVRCLNLHPLLILALYAYKHVLLDLERSNIVPPSEALMSIEETLPSPPSILRTKCVQNFSIVPSAK